MEEAGKKEQRGLETGPSLVSSNNSVLWAKDIIHVETDHASLT